MKRKIEYFALKSGKNGEMKVPENLLSNPEKLEKRILQELKFKEFNTYVEILICKLKLLRLEGKHE